MTRHDDQSWFWDDEWQVGERQADEESACRAGNTYDDGASFLASLGDA